MALSDKQRDYLGMPSGLLGYQDVPFNSYPTTQLQIRNSVQDAIDLKFRNDAAEEAFVQTQAQAVQAEEAAEFARRLSIGSVVKPRMETLGGYRAMLKLGGGDWDVRFAPENYGAFDDIIAKKGGTDEFGNPRSAAFNPNHEHYRDFAPLRRNIALLRNYLMCQMFPDGDFIPDSHTPEGSEDLKRYHQLNQMAERLGEALASNTGQPPSFMERWRNTMRHTLKGEPLATPYSNEFMEAANIPDKGALVMYNYLYGLQESPNFRDFNPLEQNTPSHWELKPRDETIFSDDNVRFFSRSARMLGNADAYEEFVMPQLRDVNNLSVEDRNTSVELAREILEKLRKLLASSTDEQHVSQQTDPKEDESLKLLKIADSFREALALIHDAEPDAVQNNKVLSNAVEALEQLGYRMKVEAYRALSEEYEHEAGREMLKTMARVPDRFKTEKSTESLLEQVEAGLREADQLQRNSRIAAKMEQRAAQRDNNKPLNRVSRATTQALTNAALARSRRTSAAAVFGKAPKVRPAASEQSAGADNLQDALGKARHQTSRLGDMTMADSRVSSVSQEGFEYAREMERQRREAAAAANKSNTIQR